MAESLIQAEQASTDSPAGERIAHAEIVNGPFGQYIRFSKRNLQQAMSDAMRAARKIDGERTRHSF